MRMFQSSLKLRTGLGNTECERARVREKGRLKETEIERKGLGER